jgi:hypothetical protein
MQHVYTLSKAAYYGALDAQNAVTQAHGVRDQIAKLRPQASGAIAQALADLDKRLEALEGVALVGGRGRGGRGAAPSASPDSLNGASASLAGVMNLLQGADVRPSDRRAVGCDRQCADGRVTGDGALDGSQDSRSRCVERAVESRWIAGDHAIATA